MVNQAGFFKNRHNVISILNCILSVVAIILAMIAFKQNAKCTGDRTLDKLIQNTVEIELIELKRSLSVMYDNEDNISRYWRGGWADRILKEMVDTIRNRSQSYLDQFNGTTTQKRSYLVDHNWRIITSYSTRFYDCNEMKIVYNSRFGQESLVYENDESFTEIKTLKEVFKNACKSQKSFKKFGNLLLERDIGQNKNYYIQLRIGPQTYESGILSDFPSQSISKQRIYAIPIRIELKTNPRVTPEVNYSYDIIIFSSYGIDNTC